jgi:hypothetical protein
MLMPDDGQFMTEKKYFTLLNKYKQFLCMAEIYCLLTIIDSR